MHMFIYVYTQTHIFIYVYTYFLVVSKKLCVVVKGLRPRVQDLGSRVKNS